MRIKEDSLRILRFFRFFAHYGQSRPDAAGLKACSAQRELLEGLSAERIWMELKRLLSAKDPSRSLLWMRTTGILSIILPESEKWGIDTIPGLMRLEERQHWSADTMLRLMAMVRPETDVIKNLAKRLTLSNAERDRMLYWAVTSAPESRISDIEFGALLYRSNNQSLLDAMKLEAVRLADRDDESGLERILELIRVTDRWERPEFPIKGQDLLNIGMMPGEQVGHTLSVLETKWIKSGFKLSKEDLIRSLQH